MANGVFTASEGLIIVRVDGISLDHTGWDSMSGGVVTTTTGGPYQPGMFGPSIPTGGLRTISDLTVTRKWEPYLIGLFMKLHNAAGFTPATVSYTPRMKGGQSYKPITYSGLLADVTRPDSTMNSADIQYLTLMFNVADTVTQN